MWRTFYGHLDTYVPLGSTVLATELYWTEKLMHSSKLNMFTWYRINVAWCKAWFTEVVKSSQL